MVSCLERRYSKGRRRIRPVNREGNQNLKVGKWEGALGKKDVRTLVLYDRRVPAL